MKRLSVIIPGYNTSKELWKRCIASVRSALGSNDEIIVVDDGSKVPVDASWFTRELKVIRRENGGLSRARNSGMEVAQGQYVAFVDSDDEVCSDAFNYCIDAMVSCDADIAIHGVRTVWAEEGIVKTDVLPGQFYGKMTAKSVHNLINARLFNYAWNKVYRRSFLDANNIRFEPEGMPCEDVIFNLNCVMAGAKWCTVDYVGYVYYRVGMTLLSTYKPSNHAGLKLANDTWIKYKQSVPDGYAVFGKFGECDEASLLNAEWANLWKPRSPYNWHQKREWLKAHYEQMHCTKTISRMMLERAIFAFLRQHCYIRPIRRWNIKRQYPKAVDIKREVEAKG